MGTIRSIASQYKDKNAINDAIVKYISHGVVKDQWEKKQRSKMLCNFIEKTNDAYTQMAVINLAAEMAKLAKN